MNDLFSLNGKCALITGASGSCGRHFAMVLARAGAAVALTARRLDELKTIAAEINAVGGKAAAFTLDVTDPTSIDDAFTIRGENVYPSEIDAVLNQLGDYGGEHRIVISRQGAMDELLVQVEGNAEVYQKGDLGGLQQRAAARLHQVLGIRTRVEVVPQDTFPRTDFKARRVIDDREVFRALHQRLEQG